MKENTLLKIALICSIIGLVILYFLSNSVKPKEYTPTMETFEVGEFVKAKGVVSEISKTENVIIIDINQYYPLTIIAFDNKEISL